MLEECRCLAPAGPERMREERGRQREPCQDPGSDPAEASGEEQGGAGELGEDDGSRDWRGGLQPQRCHLGRGA